MRVPETASMTVIAEEKQDKCPHCRIGVNLSGYATIINNINMPLNSPSFRTTHTLIFLLCPLCKESVIALRETILLSDGSIANITDNYIYPNIMRYDYAPQEVDAEYADDYNEAIKVLDISPNASSALSRRCLQNLLRHKISIKLPDGHKSTLDNEIQAYIKLNPPSYISEGLEDIRKVGNIASHPFKHITTGEIVNVPKEFAEHTIIVLQQLFDHLFVAPAKAKQRKAEIEKTYNNSKKK